MKQADFIIIGAGSAGCVLANRLTADGKTTVILIEAGGEDRQPYIHLPVGYVKTMVNPAINWMFKSEPEKGTFDRSIDMPRGKVLGSSSINGMIYVRGQSHDYDSWAQSGNKGWSFQDVLPYFKKTECFEGITKRLQIRNIVAAKALCMFNMCVNIIKPWIKYWKAPVQKDGLLILIITVMIRKVLLCPDNHA